MDINKYHNCMNCKLKKDSLLNELSKEELEIINRRRHTVIYEKGETIFKEGGAPNNYICLSKGKAKIVMKINPDKTKVIDLKKPVESLGFHSLLAKSSYDYSAIAIEKSQVCSINSDDFFEVIERNPKLSLKIIDYLNKQLDTSTNRFIAYNNKNMKAKMSYLLLLLTDIFGKDSSGKLKIKLTRAEMADLSNMDTSNAIRTLSDLSAKGLIKLDKKDIYIVDKEGLEKLAS